MKNKYYCVEHEDYVWLTTEEYNSDLAEGLLHYLKANDGFYFGMDRNGNKGYFEDFEESIGE